jgi:AraC-like DNA-binding protein
MSGGTRHLLHSATLPRYLGRLRAAGGDPGPLLARYGLPADAPDLASVDVALEDFQALSDALSQQLGDPFMGLNLAKMMPPAAFGIIELSARSAPSFEAGAQRLVRYVGLLNDFEVFTLEKLSGGSAAIDHRIPGVPLALGRHGNEQLLALITRVCREIVQKPWTPQKVAFAHPAPPDVTPLRAFFGTHAIEFGLGHNALHFSAATLELPVATANANLLTVLDEQAHRTLGTTSGPGGELARVRERIRLELQDGPPSLDRVAEGLKMSARTLQRRLGDIGLSFTGLVEETRRELAQDYLARSNLALAEVAFVLGYADLATFIRAFKRWTGKTPKVFREHERAKARNQPG